MKSEISIVIPTYDSNKLETTLQSIINQTKISLVKEILVVGKHEFKGSDANQRYRYIPVLDRPTPARNRNIGCQEATEDWILFTDSDCIPQAEWVENIAKEFNSSNSIICGSVDVPPGMSYWGLCDHYAGFGDQAYRVFNGNSLPYAATLNFCIRKDLFTKLNGFNEVYTSAGGEDRDLCWRAALLGEKISYTQKAIVFHNHSRSSLKSAWNHLFHYGQVTVKFRGVNNSSNFTRRLGYSLIKLPILGEFLAFIRSFLRISIRLIQRPFLFKIIHIVPGIFLLEIAFNLGMVEEVRENAS